MQTETIGANSVLLKQAHKSFQQCFSGCAAAGMAHDLATLPGRLITIRSPWQVKHFPHDFYNCVVSSLRRAQLVNVLQNITMKNTNVKYLF